MSDFLYNFFLETGSSVLTTWLTVFLLAMVLFSLSRFFLYFRSVKIQKRKYNWAFLRHELFWSALNVGITGFVLKNFGEFLVARGYMTTDYTPASWYVVLFEFALYFFIFDFYFYCVHRLLHVEPLYRWFHLTHHRSVTPNPLSSTSMTPVEGVAEGLIVPVFFAVFTVHEATAILIIPFATIMGLYVHCGYEFAPRWWYRTRTTSWFITPMFHDQHHQFFRCNYGAFTTIWDRVFGTVRPRFEQDFDRLKESKAGLRTELKTG